MSEDRRARLRDASGEAPRRVRGWAMVAVVLALLGVVASVRRPFAPALPVIPTDLDAFDPAVLAAVEGYRAPLVPVALIATVLPLVVPAVAVMTPWGRRVVVTLAGGDRAPARRAALLALGVTLATSVLTLPLAAWVRLDHDARWEFRTQSAAAWLGDWSAVTAGRAALVTAAVGFGVWVARRWPRSWPYRLTVGATVAAGLGVMLHPVLLLPVTLPLEPLSPGAAQRATIDPVLEAAGEPALPVFIGEESRRSTRVNALATGIGPTARVVVYDNLLELPGDQVASVVAHEVAHHQHRDLPRGVLLVATAALPALLLVRRVVGSPVVRHRVSARDAGDPRLIGVVLLLVAGMQVVSQPAVNLVSRNLEAAADARALEITGDPTTLIASTRTYTVRDLSDPDPPPWIRIAYRTHPSVGERIRRAVAIADRDGLALPDRGSIEHREAGQRHPAVVEAAS